jgi:hypothetical protein
MRSGFSLDSVRIERRALAPRRPFVVSLPLPPEADRLYASLPGRGRFRTPDYADWLERAGLRLVAATPPRLKGPVWIAITHEKGAGIDGSARAVLELLARERVMESLSSLRELRLSAGPVTGVRVEVRPFGFAEA